MLHRRRPQVDIATANGHVGAGPGAVPITPPPVRRGGPSPLGSPRLSPQPSPLRSPSGGSSPGAYGGAGSATHGYPLPNGYGAAYAPAYAYGGAQGFGADPALGIETAASYAASYGHTARRSAHAVISGIRDATRLERSWGLVWGDAELRSQVVKLTLINLISLSLLALFPFVLSPLFARDAAHDIAAVAATTAEVRGWFNALVSYPLFAVCFWVNAIWGPGIARRAQGMLHPSYRHQPMHSTAAPSPTTVQRVWLTLTRLLLIADFTLVARTVSRVPYIGRMLSLYYVCLINAYYAYEWIFASREWSLNYRCAYISARVGYMFGFGLPATLLTSFGPPLINMVIFSLIYPFYLIQALQSRPPSSNAMLPSSPSPSTSTPSTPTKEAHLTLPAQSPVQGVNRSLGGQGYAPSVNLNHGSDRWDTGSNMDAAAVAAAVVRRAHVPLFFFARHALAGLKWLVDAIARERGGSQQERALGKRVY